MGGEGWRGGGKAEVSGKDDRELCGTPYPRVYSAKSAQGQQNKRVGANTEFKRVRKRLKTKDRCSCMVGDGRRVVRGEELLLG
jgi:hypothetical protein